MVDSDDMATEELRLLRLKLEELSLENDLLREELTAPPDQGEQQGWQRRWLSIVCAVLGALLLPVAVLTVWARNTMLDTDEYVATVAPLAEDENIQEAVALQVTDAVTEAVDIRGVAEEVLPGEAAVLAGPIEAGASDFIFDLVKGVVASSEFSDVWTEANRLAHSNVVPILTGEDSEAVNTSGGRVVVNLGSVAEEAVIGVDESLGTELASQVPIEEIDAEIVLVESNELADVQGLMRVIDNLSWFSLILALGFLVGAVAFSEQRRLGARRLGIAVMVPMLLSLVAYAVVRQRYLAGIPSEVVYPDALAATFDILTSFLARAFRSLLVLGLLILLGAWVVGPSHTAGRVRNAWDTLLGRAGANAADREVGPIPRAVAANEQAFLVAAAVLGGAALVLWTNPTGFVVLLLALATAVAMGVIRLVAEVGRRGGTEPEPPIDLTATVVAEPDPARSEMAVIEEITVGGPVGDSPPDLELDDRPDPPPRE